MDPISSRYGEAAFDLAKSAKQEKLWLQQAKEVLSLFESTGLDWFLNQVMIPLEAKKETVKKLFEKELAKDLVTLMLLMLDKGRQRYIQPALVDLVARINRDQGIVEGIVYAVKPLKEEEKTILEKTFSELLHKQVSLRARIDKNLLAGWKVMIQDRIWDGSLQSNFEALKREALKEGA
ncbi:MAG: ATP synthase F1 subunit delta [Erysipelotrichaceae bacterium]|jgi:F-type H+-transporting ATPase subunit delta|nr:ATP synthase F1 subunit delta [Erysipelotrichaceae bacterium]